MNTSTGEGFVCSTADLADAEWGCQGTDILAANPTCVGCGDTNTDEIITNCLVGTTAAEVAKAFDDGSTWFLPSSEELQQMYFNLEQKGHVNFNTAMGFSYWSSTHSNTGNSIGLTFSNGNLNVLNKNLERYVRAVREF